MSNLSTVTEMTPAVIESLEKTILKNASPAERTAFLAVCKTYQLNPFLKEIHAFPSKGGGIVPMVGIDGWLSLVNRHPQHDGLETENVIEGGKLIAVKCTIHRKDRSKPTVVSERMDECVRVTEPWKISPARMLRHKAIIQCARVAYGFSGIHDEDDVAVIAAAAETERSVNPSEHKEEYKEDLRKKLIGLARESKVALTDLVGVAKLNGLDTEMNGTRETLSLEALETMVERWSELNLNLNNEDDLI